jgi:hypothetical protein
MAALLLVSSLWFVPEAQAAEVTACTNITSLPAVITSQGIYCLKQDLSTAITNGRAIDIQANNVTLNCNGYKIGGLGAGTASTAYGIYVANHMNATIRECNIRGFYIGMMFYGESSGYHLVEDNRLNLNLYEGIDFYHDMPATVRRNQIYDTGGSTYFSSGALSAYGIRTNGNVEIIDNTIKGVTSSGATAAIGISMDDGDMAIGNRVTGVAGAIPFGISAASDGALVERNFVRVAAGPNSRGIRCFGSGGPGTTLVRDNSMILSGGGAAIDSSCFDAGGNISR